MIRIKYQHRKVMFFLVLIVTLCAALPGFAENYKISGSADGSGTFVVDDGLAVYLNGVEIYNDGSAHEEVVTGTLTELAEKYASADTKGEIVLVIAGDDGLTVKVKGAAGLAERVRELELAGEEKKTALKRAAKEFGMTRSEAYRQLHSEQKAK